MRYKLIYEGTGVSELREKLPQLEAQHVPEGGLAELVIDFRYRFPGFDNIAILVNDNLRRHMGVTPWPGTYQIVYVDPDHPRWYIRWQKGAAWAAYIVAALVAIAVIVVTIGGWRLLQAIPTIIEEYEWLVPVAVVGTLAVLLIYGLRSRGP